MPFVMGETGTLESIAIYHEGGTGQLQLAVYDDFGPDGIPGTSDDGLPGNRLGMTPQTKVNSSAGWQTVALSEPVAVLEGQTIWLAWVFENPVAVRWAWATGYPGRADSGQSWSSGPEPMPEEFGSSSQSNYVYSIYVNYLPASSASMAVQGDDAWSDGGAESVAAVTSSPAIIAPDASDDDDEDLLLPLHVLSSKESHDKRVNPAPLSLKK
jgi:hypothetical protein